MIPVLYIVIPCYNEEKVIPITSKLFMEALHGMIVKKKISDNSRILFVNDGSKDDTWEIIRQLVLEDYHYLGISQSRNRGHQNAVYAGLMYSMTYCDAAVSIDCDGQDDIEAIEKMVDQFTNGVDVVYGVRSKRDTDSWFKRFTAESFYKILESMGVEVVFNHADYRLLSMRVIRELKNYKEVNLFLRGLIPLIGFKSTCVYYERHERIAGDSHYPLNKMLGLAFDGITSLSIKPLHLISVLGLIVASMSFAGIIWAIIALVAGSSVAGWASTICIICFVCGVQLISLGIIGEYIGKIYLEVKERPRYIISDVVGSWIDK